MASTRAPVKRTRGFDRMPARAAARDQDIRLRSIVATIVEIDQLGNSCRR